MTVMNIGSTIDGRYRIGAQIGVGGMGTVCAAEDLQLERTVAIKLMNPMMLGSVEARDRFNREAVALSKLMHKNIVRVYSCGVINQSRPYLVMELLSGRSLTQVLKEERVIPVISALKVLRQVAEALRVAHAEGIIHRDVKPSNIFIGSDDTVKLVDFGLCKVEHDDSGQQVTQEGWAVGSLHYMSPQCCRGMAADASADVYALGIVLYEMVTGKLPFDSTDSTELMAKHIRDPIPSLSKEYPLLAHATEIDGLLQQCLAKEVSDRLADGQALADELDLLLAKISADDPMSTREPNPLIDVVVPKRARRLSIYIMIGASLAVLLVICAALSHRVWTAQQSRWPGVQEGWTAEQALSQADVWISLSGKPKEMTDLASREKRTSALVQARVLVDYAETKLAERKQPRVWARWHWHSARVCVNEGNDQAARQMYFKLLPLAKQAFTPDEYLGVLEDTKKFYVRILMAKKHMVWFSRSAGEPAEEDPQATSREFLNVLAEEAKLRLARKEFVAARKCKDQAKWIVNLANLSEKELVPFQNVPAE
jgi:serine/threonine protein kinase